MKDKPLTVEVVDDQLVISIGIDTLAFASSWENGGPVKDLSILPQNYKRWAKRVARAIENEDCGEASYINRFLDEAIERAAEY